MSRRIPTPSRAVLPLGRAANITDVARVAGVSKATVSRFLSGKTQLLSEATWKGIQEAVEALGYQPSQIARSLKGGQTRLIGMVVADVENPYSMAVLRGAEAECHRAGYLLALCNSGGSHDKERELLAGLRAYRIEGLILNCSGEEAEHAAGTIPKGLPLVLLDRRLPNGKAEGGDFDFVGLDNSEATATAVHHLAGNGFSEIALIIEPVSGVSVRSERVTGFHATLKGLPSCHGQVIEVDLRHPGAMGEALSAFLAAPARGPRAVIAGSGLVTLRLAQHLQVMGLSMPRDVGLVGFDELEWSSLVSPGITTISQPTHEIGVSAVRNLLARLGGEESPPHNTIFPGNLIVRASSAPVGAPVDMQKTRSGRLTKA